MFCSIPFFHFILLFTNSFAQGGALMSEVTFLFHIKLERIFRKNILGPSLFLLYINDLPHIICDTAIYADDTTIYSKCDHQADLWKQLELASELESDLNGTVDWGKKQLIDFTAAKTQLVSFDRYNNTGAIDVTMHASVLGKK